MADFEKVKSSNTQVRSSPRLSAIKAAAHKRQSHPKNSSMKSDSIEDPYGPATDSKDVQGKTTALVYDVFMTEHYNPWDSEHVEKPQRMTQAYARCQELNLVERCQMIPTRFATDEELELVHSKDHLQTLKEICHLANNPETLEEAKLRCISNYQGVYVNGKTLDCTRMAAAAAIDLVGKIVGGEVSNGMALVRPPGHHAMTSEFNGFCLCNNVAIAAKNAIKNLGVQRVLIVDFDAHHGQATQREFYNTSQVLYVSIHRYEHGSFWPNLRESNFDAIGARDTDGHGYNVNFPLNEIGMGDSEYLAMFHQVILPMAYEYSPELVIVSAGFDAAFGCPEGCMRIMPAAYGHMISSLMALANGKVAVVLEGGYFVPTVAEGSAMCLRALLGDYCLSLGPLPEPKPSLVDTILNVLTMLKNNWTFLRIQDEHSEQEKSHDSSKKTHKPIIEYRGEGLVELLYSKVYDSKLHYFNHSPERLLELIAEFNQIQSGYEMSLKTHKVRCTKLAMVYDELMMRHKNEEESGHPEQPKRIERIYKCLKEFGILERTGFEHLASRRATDEEILLAHDQSHLDFLKSIPEKTQTDLNKMAERLDSIYLNPETTDCALLSAGSLLEVVDAVVMNKSEKGLAVIRPPGHHAEEDEANGFCILNNVAIAVKYALEIHGLKRILVVDWDVHHGNGIQNMFYQDPRVLYISLHRYDNGTFFPGKPDANSDFVGSGPGEGFNINIPWNCSGLGDTEYLLALFNIILPVGYQFDPELVLVSAGFDAAWGDPLGKCKLSPEVYGHMTHHLQSLANGKIIVALEGGYNLNSISYSMTMCAKALVGDRLPPIKPKEPLESAKDSIKSVVWHHSKYWACLRYDLSLPDKVSNSLESSGPQSTSPTDATDYVPLEYGTPSSTSSVNTLTASRHYVQSGQTSDTKDYFKESTISEAIDIQLRRLALSGDVNSPLGQPELDSREYLPSQYGQYASSTHTNTLSRSLDKPCLLISTESKTPPSRSTEGPSE